MSDYTNINVAGSIDISDVPINKMVAGCVSGDRRSQKEFFHKHVRSVYSFCYRQLGPGFDTDEIVQQIFIKVFSSLKSFKGLSSIETWIYRISSKVCTDQLRSKYRKRKLDIISDSDTLASEGGPGGYQDPSERLENKELAKSIYLALSKLSEEKRVVIVLYEMEKKSLEEIAALIEAPIGTVKSRIFHARLELQKHLSRYLETNL
jgi:RNA polymerase sigma-70 factor (ECF subfamily)